MYYPDLNIYKQANFMSKEPKQHHIRSFVSRQRNLAQEKQQLLKELWPIYGMELSSLPEELTKILQQNNSITIEIGFGMGESLFQMALANPSQFFLGIEVHRPGIVNLLAKLKNQPLANLCIIEADAMEVFNKHIPDNSIDRVLLFFPDPWPKRKQQKRRILRQEFLLVLQQKLKAQGILHFVTDWEDYAQAALKLFSTNKNWRNLAGTNIFSNRPDYRPITKFEKRGLKLGHKIWELVFATKS